MFLKLPKIEQDTEEMERGLHENHVNENPKL
jgi:hypothetical protein